MNVPWLALATILVLLTLLRYHGASPCPASWVITPGPWPVQSVSSLLTSDVPTYP